MAFPAIFALLGKLFGGMGAAGAGTAAAGTAGAASTAAPAIASAAAPMAAGVGTSIAGGMASAAPAITSAASAAAPAATSGIGGWMSKFGSQLKNMTPVDQVNMLKSISGGPAPAVQAPSVAMGSGGPNRQTQMAPPIQSQARTTTLGRLQQPANEGISPEILELLQRLQSRGRM